MGIEGVGLKNHRNPAFGRRQMLDPFSTDADFPLVDIFQTCDQTQKSGFAAS